MTTRQDHGSARKAVGRSVGQSDGLSARLPGNVCSDSSIFRWTQLTYSHAYRAWCGLVSARGRQASNSLC